MFIRKQAGLSISNLMFWAAIAGVVFLVGLKVLPAYNEFFSARTAIQSVVKEQAGAPAAAKRESFNRKASIDNVSAITGDDLDISPDPNTNAISFAYDKEVPLVANVSLLFHFSAQASSKSK